MSASIFQDKEIKPSDADLAERIGSVYPIWKKIHDLVLEKYPKGIAEWNYPGKIYGWSYRIKDKKRAIIYLLPRDNYFQAAFVFGQKAYDMIMESDISLDIKTALSQARKYAEGRGIRIDIENDSLLSDIEQLIKIKLSN